MRMRTWALAVAAAVGAAVGGPAFGQQPKPPAATPTAAAPSAPLKGPAAVVNGESITLAQIDAVINRDGPQAVQQSEAKLREMRHAALAMMIDNVLFQQYIRKNCPPANPKEVADELAKVQE